MTASNSYDVVASVESIVFFVVTNHRPPSCDFCSNDITSVPNRIYCFNWKWSAYRCRYSRYLECCR